MGKGDNRKGNKETKKPKKEKPKASATNDLNAGRASLNVGGKKVK